VTFNSGLEFGRGLRYRVLRAKEIRLIRVVAALPGAEDSIVELRFHPHVSLNALPRYHALSYTWGDPTKTKAILVDGVVVQVTNNLEEFFRYHRQDLADKIETQ
jgi:hypothetical protein